MTGSDSEMLKLSHKIRRARDFQLTAETGKVTVSQNVGDGAVGRDGMW